MKICIWRSGVWTEYQYHPLYGSQGDELCFNWRICNIGNICDKSDPEIAFIWSV